jgi:hypothetical protein
VRGAIPFVLEDPMGALARLQLAKVHAPSARLREGEEIPVAPLRQVAATFSA